MNKLIKIFLLQLFIYPFIACSGSDKDDETVGVEPVVISSIPVAGATVKYSIDNVSIVFNTRIVISNFSKITIDNQAKIGGVSQSASTLTLNLDNIKDNMTYNILIEAGAITAEDGLYNSQDIRLTFKTEKKAELVASLVTPDASVQAKNIYEFLKENYQLKTLSATMANVNWNISEAERVYRWTGKYPAMNCFDYVHHMFSPANWINYEDISVVENWWENNGLVAAMWHWNVPTEKGSSDYSFYYTGKGGGNTETSFDITKAVQEGTYENNIIKADLDVIAGYLLLLKEKNIPVIWRPLHEAAGGWFWWGANGSDAYKKLWILMFDTFKSKGINNLIWVWTTEGNDDSWYPGDDYVDIIGRDIYNKPNASDLNNEYKNINTAYPKKIIALSECGNVANITSQWTNGALWSWFMPWYDYNATDNSHAFATKEFWVDAFSSPKVITRDQLPDFK